MKFFFTTLILVFTGLIFWALGQKSISDSGHILLQDPWGIVTLVDLYLGFLIFTFFISLLESSKIKVGLWCAALLVLGNGVALAYLVFNYEKIKQSIKKSAS